MRVIYFGSGDFAVPSLRWLKNSRHEVLLVVTQPDRPAGRGKVLQPTPTAERAEVEGLPVLKFENVNAPEVVEQLAVLQADIGVVAAFGQKILEPVRSVFRLGCINLHGSLLPKFRGASPIVGAILAGERKTGVTVFRLVDRMDAGPILLKRETMIGPTETAGELHDRLASVACDAIGSALDLLERDPTAGEPQDESQASVAKKLKKVDGYLRFDESAEQLALRVRALWPWPATRCRFVPADAAKRPVEISLVVASAVPVVVKDPPGTILPTLTVATGQGALEIYSVQPAGSKLMSWQEFVNGRRVQPGDRLEPVLPA